MLVVLIGICFLLLGALGFMVSTILLIRNSIKEKKPDKKYKEFIKSFDEEYSELIK